MSDKPTPTRASTEPQEPPREVVFDSATPRVIHDASGHVSHSLREINDAEWALVQRDRCTQFAYRARHDGKLAGLRNEFRDGRWVVTAFSQGSDER